MIGATSGLLSAYLPESEARAIYGASPDVISGGVFAPTASATLRDGQYRVSGRWRFASGCQHCDWLMGGCVVQDDGPPRARMVLFPAADAEIIDTWTVSGLRGTGSHDIAVRDLLVPATRSASLTHDRPVASGALYAAVRPARDRRRRGRLGIARRARRIVALAVAKTPTAARRTLAERSTIQPPSPRPRRRWRPRALSSTRWSARRGRPLAAAAIGARARACGSPPPTPPRRRATDAAYGWRRNGGVRRQPAPAYVPRPRRDPAHDGGAGHGSSRSRAARARDRHDDAMTSDDFTTPWTSKRGDVLRVTIAHPTSPMNAVDAATISPRSSRVRRSRRARALTGRGRVFSAGGASLVPQLRAPGQ